MGGEKIKPKMSVAQTTEPTQEKKKLSYEELTTVAMQYQQQNAQLRQQIDQLNYAGLIQQLTFLFKVLENPTYFSSEYLMQCAAQIQMMLDLPTPEELQAATSEKPE